MRRTSTGFFSVVVACALVACASLGVPTPHSFNEKTAAALTGLAAARDTTRTLIDERMISSNDANNIELQLETLRSGVDVARQIHESQPKAGEARIDTIVVSLQALTNYLQARHTAEVPK